MLARLIPMLVAAALAGAAAAQDVRLYRPDERVDPREVARILDARAEAPRPKYRSLRLLDEPAAPVAAQPPTSALALPVPFEFDSAEILPQARPQLDAVAAGIRLLAPARPITIEGHTDAVGSDKYNLDLSMRRAQAVKQYLVRVHGIDERRFRTIGFGEKRPFNAEDREAAENRRVQFRGT